jgi:hypothetical protein
MAVDVDKSRALATLNASLEKCSSEPSSTCRIADTIDFVMRGHNCLTYRYIMFTALVAKATDERVDVLSLQASDESAGAYDARSLASKVVFPFQRSRLGDAMDGSNSDPLVNKPGRFQRLRPSNPTQGGDPKKALAMLCEYLPKVTTSEEARQCVDYIVSGLIAESRRKSERLKGFKASSSGRSASDAYKFLSNLLDQGFGGAALVIVTDALYRMRYADQSYAVVPHPANQPGRSSRQFSDLDVLRDGRAWMGTECKDKPYTATDVEHAADTAIAAGAVSLRFVAGRQASLQAPPAYFAGARDRYAKRGIIVGVVAIDDLLDITFTEYADTINAADVYENVRKSAEGIGALEAQMWVYEHASDGFEHRR